MDIGAISIRYARALLKAATAEGLEDKVYQDMMTLAKSYLEVDQLRQTVENPMLSKEKKEGILAVAAGEQPSVLTRNFINLVLKEGRENVMQFKQKNIIRGKLTTAARVSAQTEQKMRQMVESKTNGTVEFETEVNPDIIGGFILEYDTYRMDASVKSKLNTILTQLSK